MESTSSQLFTWRQIFFYTAGFLGVVVFIQRGQRYVCENLVTFDCPYYWPVSIFSPHFPSVRDLAVALIVIIAFFIFLKFIEIKRLNIWLIGVAGVLLIAGSTFIQGLDVGYYAPVAGDAQSGVLTPYSLDGQEYYHDALKVSDPVDFFRRYNEIQPTLHRHAHTHPPGAVLTFYFLQKIFRNPAVIALVIMLIATFSTIFFFYRLIRTELSDETARYVSFLLVLLPAVQIYYLATLDALIVALLTGTLYLFCFGKGRGSVGGALVLLASSFLLTFVSLFILPVLIGFDLIVKRSLKRSIIVIGGIVLIYALIYLFTGYDAWHSFRTASHHENPDGFMLFVDPVNYLFTRVEDVAEIIFFFGPFLLVLFFRGIKGKYKLWPVRDFQLRPLLVLTALGCASLLGMYIVGAWRTGETARACAYIYPYLLFPVGMYLEDSKSGVSERHQLASLVFIQSVGMQLFGNYLW